MCLKEIRNKIERFEFGAGDDAKEWEERWAETLVRCVKIDCVSWESVVEKIQQHDSVLGRDVRRFYEKTLEFNAPKKAMGIPVPGQAFSIMPLTGS
jgi:hypothetical protein